jgi:hypothetical protein
MKLANFFIQKLVLARKLANSALAGTDFFVGQIRVCNPINPFPNGSKVFQDLPCSLKICVDVVLSSATKKKKKKKKKRRRRSRRRKLTSSAPVMLIRS